MYASLTYKSIVERSTQLQVLKCTLLYRTRTRSHMLSENRMTIEEVLVKQYGPLLSLDQLATILDRSPQGLRISLRSSGEWVRKINAARLRLGRRVYFRTSEIANVLDAR